MLTTLVVGATGATGRLLVQQLLDRGCKVRVIVRSPHKLSEEIRNHAHLSLTQASLLELHDDALIQHVNGCDAVAVCLGHVMSLRGIYGHPRRLVAHATQKLCAAIKTQTRDQPIKVVLMNTAGNSNRDLSEPASFAQQVVVRLIRLLLPPHADNEQAADYLRVEVGQNNPLIEWAVVRPDTLVNQAAVSAYALHPSPTRSPIFNAGTTSRINVGHCMAELITRPELWTQWKGQMPVIYNKI